MRNLAVFLACMCLLSFSGAAMEAALTSAQVFVNGVMPALFPMMVLSRLFLPGLSKNGRKVFFQTVLFGFLSGSPASAQRAAASPVPPRLWEPLLCASGVMSPMFFTGTLAAWTEDASMAGRMLIIHWLGALVTAGIWRVFATARAAPPEPDAQKTSLPSAIAGSARAMLSVLGAMMLFSIASAVVRAGLSALFPAWTAQNGRLFAVMWAILEIGGGAGAVIKCFPAVPWALLSGLCAFGGLSIWLQNMLFVHKSIRPAKLLLMRMLHGAVCYGMMQLTLLF